MSRHWTIAVALFLGFLELTASPVLARTWTSASGTFKVDADLVEARPDGTLLLKRTDGKTIRVKLDVLSQADQDFVRQQSARPPNQKNTLDTKPPDKRSTSDARRPVPDAKVLAKTLGELRVLLRADYEKARTDDAGRQALLDKLKQLANDALAKDPTGAFAVASLAAEAAADGGDLTKALSSLTWLEQRFQITDGPARKAELIGRLKVDSLPAASAAAVMPRLLSIMEERENAADYEGAMEMGRLAVRAARRAGDSKMVSQVTVRGRQLKEQKEIYESAAAALVTLKTNPHDAQANLQLGKFLCLVRSKWDEGLPHLVAGGDTELSPVAKRDLAGPTSASDRAGLADQWWTLSELPKYRSQAETLKRRAAHWYQFALPQLTALDKLRAEKRIEQSGINAPEMPNYVTAVHDSSGSGGGENLAKGQAGPSSKLVLLKQIPFDFLGGCVWNGTDLVSQSANGSSSRAPFRTDMQYVQIQGTISASPGNDGGTQSAVILRVIVDDRQVYISPILKPRGTRSARFRIPIKNAQKVLLICDLSGPGSGTATLSNVVLTKK